MDKNEPWKEYMGAKGHADPKGAKFDIQKEIRDHIGPCGLGGSPRGLDSPEERKHKIVLSNIDTHGLILKLAEQSLSRNGFMKVLRVIEEEDGSIIDWGLLGDTGEPGQPGNDLSNED